MSRPRASQPCVVPGCPELRPCSTPGHTPTPWGTKSKRTTRRTMSGWDEQKLNARVMRDHAGICHVCHKAGADQVDHVIPRAQGGGDGYSNRRPIHKEPCHRLKTAEEAAAGRKGWQGAAGPSAPGRKGQSPGSDAVRPMGFPCTGEGSV